MIGDDRQAAAADEAARWYARIRADGASEADRAAFRHWRTGDPANARAWSAVSRAEDGLVMAGDDPAVLAMVAAARASRAAPRRSWRPMAAAAAVALVAGLAGAMAMRVPGSGEPVRVAQVAAADALRRLHLPDGSVMTLDAGAAATVRAPAAERRVTVTRGRAMFAVARDAAHPFVVSVGAATVTALGTHFSVEAAPAGIVVALMEGSVRVATPAGARLLVPGDVLTIAAGGARLRHGAAGAATGWRQGVLTFDNMPLAEVAAQLNRYAGPRIVVDAELARRPFSGVLHARGGGAALADALDAYGTARTASRTPDRIVLTAR